MGYTSDIKERLKRHNEGRSVFTRRDKPWDVVYTEVFSHKREAIQRELEIKNKKSKKYIEDLIYPGVEQPGSSLRLASRRGRGLLSLCLRYIFFTLRI